MKQHKSIYVFGEVLFDCFSSAEQVLGGAPFNVAWHLQALGDNPEFISRVGDDDLGTTILQAMAQWGMTQSRMQVDKVHETGRVDIELINHEPHYDIKQDVAYDFIDSTTVSEVEDDSVLYHGTLALRKSTSYETLQKLTANPHLCVFLDINLRPPWWNKQTTCALMERATWVKLNQDELKQLGYQSADIKQDMTRLQTNFQLEQLIVTCGENGAVIRTNDGQFHEQKPQLAAEVVDTVGAGDAFTAMYLHGLLNDWDIAKSLDYATRFASRVVGLRGAISTQTDLYQKLG